MTRVASKSDNEWFSNASRLVTETSGLVTMHRHGVGLHFSFYVDRRFCLLVSVYHMYAVPRAARRGNQIPRTGVTDG